MFDILKKEILPHAEEYCKSNWDEILSAMKELLSLQEIYIHEGILALKDSMDDINNQNFRYIIRLIVDGESKQRVKDFVIGNYYLNKISGLEAYLYLIYACGMLLIQELSSNGTLIKQFQSLVPYDYREKIPYELEEKEYIRLANLIAQDKIEETLDFKFEDDLFAKIIIKLSSKDMPKLISCIDILALTKALKFSTPEVIKKFCNAMSKRTAGAICKDINSVHCSKADSDSAKGQIFASINYLNFSGALSAINGGE